MSKARLRPYSVIKFLCDRIASVLMLIIFMPILLIVAILVRIRLGSPILYVQPRPGRNNHVFNLYKFRTMETINPTQSLISDESRLSRFGMRLRSTSLDELPTLFNVVKGDMSLVGPRPLLVKYLELYSPEQLRRHEVRPGITGLAQVRGRNLLSWNEKFDLDLYYVDHFDAYLDLKILINTIRAVFSRRGISSDESVTMAEFEGNR